MSRGKVLIAATVALACAALSTAPASASPPGSNERVRVTVLLEAAEQGRDLALSESDKELLHREISGATSVLTLLPANELSDTAIALAAYTGCWSRAAEQTFYGGVTNAAIFGVGQSTKVCVSSGKVTSVSVINRYMKFYGYPGVSQSSLTANTNNVGWEGRGLAIGTAYFGVKIGDYGVGAQKTLCTQIRLNANGYSYQASKGCNL